MGAEQFDRRIIELQGEKTTYFHTIFVMKLNLATSFKILEKYLLAVSFILLIPNISTLPEYQSPRILNILPT